MTQCYTNLPKYIGEQNLAKQLTSFNEPKLHLWFGLDFIPGVRDIDILLWHEDIGVFIIEVKAVHLKDIEFFGWESYKIQGREVDDSPCRQADKALNSLRNYLRPQMPNQKLPFLVGTTCWPLISREEWNHHWDDERVMGEFSERMFFKEDIESGLDILLDRLRYVWSNPPVKAPPKYEHYHQINQLDKVKKCLSVEARKKAAPSDIEKLKNIEKRLKKKIRDEILPNSGKRILYSGYPGTGKTFRLLQIGTYHAFEGAKKVLFVCFNKVLASDMRRVFSYSEKVTKSEGSIRVQDVFAIAQGYADGQWAEDHDTWGELVLEKMKKVADRLPKYETVLIDEAQDMKNWALEMIELLSAPNATVCVAAGSGQELYGQSAQWLEKFKQNASREIGLNRNFRNAAPIAKFAHVFYEAAIDSNKIAKTLSEVDKKNDSERSDGQPPSLLNIDESWCDDFSVSFYIEILADEYKKIIKNQIELLDKSRGDCPLDFLVLVPDTNGIERTCALKAIEGLKIDFIDYTNVDYRRDIAQSNMVRLCTFHSARGIEGRRVIIFGIEQLESLCAKINISLNNLGYITFSRSAFECVICVKTKIKSDVNTFIENILKAIHKV
jgi:hypothetical protein